MNTGEPDRGKILKQNMNEKTSAGMTNQSSPADYDFVTAKPVIRHEQELSATLTGQQNAILQKIKDNHTELMNLGERDAFVRGFSLAVRMMVDVMSQS